MGAPYCRPVLNQRGRQPRTPQPRWSAHRSAGCAPRTPGSGRGAEQYDRPQHLLPEARARRCEPMPFDVHAARDTSRARADVRRADQSSTWCVTSRSRVSRFAAISPGRATTTPPDRTARSATGRPSAAFPFGTTPCRRSSGYLTAKECRGDGRRHRPRARAALPAWITCQRRSLLAEFGPEASHRRLGATGTRAY
jgi:hypothetical protein